MTRAEDLKRFELLNLIHKDSYDTCDYNHLTYNTYTELLDLGFINPDDTQNEAPSFNEIANFCKDHPNFTMHGYVVTPSRPDCRISCEGVECDFITTIDDIVDFTKMFKYADEFEVTENSCYAWFD